MRFKGKITEYGISYETNKPFVTLEVEGKILDQLNELKDKVLDITLSIFREKRSLRANRFYWEILGQLAQKLKTSTTELHNQYLCQCGYIQFESDYPVMVVMKADVDYLKMEGQHVKPTSEITVDDNGEVVCTYYLLRGSHTFNTAEMSHLIDLLIADAKAQGIDTLTEDEKQRMMQAYEAAKPWEKEKQA